MKITDNLLDVAKWQASPNHGGVIRPRLIIIHYTGDNNLIGAVDWLCDPDSGVSSHLVIGKKGEVYQLVPFNIRAWHAGVSNYHGVQNCNGFSIGIENVGTGNAWPEAQISVLLDCMSALVAAYKIEAIVGHSDVAPKRKADPGPKFPWNRVKARFPDLIVHKVLVV